LAGSLPIRGAILDLECRLSIRVFVEENNVDNNFETERFSVCRKI
jgi:hypothetical protein